MNYQQSNDRLLCIYHGNCADGFTSAWAVWKKHPDAQFVKGIYGEAPPDCTNREVVIVDFSYKRDVLIEMAKQAKSILILDHHISAEKDLVDLPENVTTIFDMNRSGAMITWEYYHPDEPISLLIQHVQDRDLFLFNIPNTSTFQSNLFSYEYTFENWDKVENICGNVDSYNYFIEQGIAIERKHLKDVKELIELNQTETIIAGFVVPLLNAPYFYSSEAGNLMSKNRPFAACYWDTPTGRVFSLRSHPSGEDVSVIASKFGGGGHKHASGFRLTLEQLHNSSFSLQGTMDELINYVVKYHDIQYANQLLSTSELTEPHKRSLLQVIRHETI